MNRRGFLNLFGLAPFASVAARLATLAAGAQKNGVYFAASDPLGDFLASIGYPPSDYRSSSAAWRAMLAAPWDGRLSDGFGSELVQAAACGSKHLRDPIALRVPGFGMKRAFDLRENFVRLYKHFSDGWFLSEQQHEQDFDRDQSAGQLNGQVVEGVGSHSVSSPSSVGVATPMVTESEVSSGNVASDSVHILRDGRAS